MYLTVIDTLKTHVTVIITCYKAAPVFIIGYYMVASHYPLFITFTTYYIIQNFIEVSMQSIFQ